MIPRPELPTLDNTLLTTFYVTSHRMLTDTLLLTFNIRDEAKGVAVSERSISRIKNSAPFPEMQRPTKALEGQGVMQRLIKFTGLHSHRISKELSLLPIC